MNALVSTDWLAEHARAVRIVDASYYLAEHARDAAAEFDAAHIPGAMFLDLATLADAASSLPMTLPAPDAITQRLAMLGIGAGEQIVLYDASPLRSSARAWWMLRMAGIADVTILDGGLAKWRADGRPLASGDVSNTPTAFDACLPLCSVRTFDAMRANLVTAIEQVVDARSPARFDGREPESRPGVEPGHIPGARSLHYAALFEADGTWKQGDALRAAFADAGVDLARPVVATCGSGVTAACLVFAAHLLGHHIALYDGSWSEWGADPATPKARA
ncbi:sulfurtransferase [Sphingomonas sp.]|jgi:thiosulfate/3-mercaptopyruvate sulfurtransferase|uniref:sulfurtransferase n=1 Tax=Sphingomonas sp. TaxID=28214 RepID=UPI002EDA3387